MSVLQRFQCTMALAIEDKQTLDQQDPKLEQTIDMELAESILTRHDFKTGTDHLGSDQIYRELLRQNPNAPGAATPPPPSRTPGQDARATDQIFRELMGQNPAPSR